MVVASREARGAITAVKASTYLTNVTSPKLAMPVTIAEKMGTSLGIGTSFKQLSETFYKHDCLPTAI